MTPTQKTTLLYALVAFAVSFLTYVVSSATVTSFNSVTDWKAWLINLLIGGAVSGATAAIKWLSKLLPATPA